MSLVARFAVRRSDGFELDVDLEVEAGETVVLLGPNGAGKSTFVEAVAGLVSIERGEIKLGGKTLDDGTESGFVPPEQRGIGIVFQDYLLFPHMTVIENVSFGMESEDAAKRLIDALGISDLSRRKATDLSGGQAQKVALARALCRDPELLVLDEPLAALDATSRAEVRRGLGDALAGFEGPRILITHDPTEAFMLADHIHVLEGGLVTQSGTPDEIRLTPRTPYAADLAGANLFQGTANVGVLEIGEARLVAAETGINGPVLATVHPRAVSVHVQHPEGSPRNVWQTEINRIENYGDRVRLLTGAPLEMTAEITPAAAQALQLVVGSTVWLSVKATEVVVQPA